MTHPQTTRLTAPQCIEIVRCAPWGRLGVILDGRPAIFPVNHVVHDDRVLFRTGSGVKLDAARGREVAFQVDDVDTARAVAWSVQVSGRATEVTDPHAILDLMREQPLVPFEIGAKQHLMSIHIEQLSGILFPVDPDAVRALVEPLPRQRRRPSGRSPDPLAS